MVTVILAIAILVALAGLTVEIGIASWSIRKFDRYRHRAEIAASSGERYRVRAENAEENAEQYRRDAIERTGSLDEFAVKIFWLLNFLRERYNSFSDIGQEVNDGLKDAGDIPVGEAAERYNDLIKAYRIIQTAAKASERKEPFSEQIHLILDDFASLSGDLENAGGAENPESEFPRFDSQDSENSPE